MHFDTLEHIGIDTLAVIFNEAFAEYEIPLQFTPEALANKIRIEDINLTVSTGAFEGDKLVGFILFGLDIVNNTLYAWDGGTGVIPGYRGQKLTQQMFDHSLPILKAKGVKKILLEVLKNNVGAYNIYERSGFRNLRVLHAYKGPVTKTSSQQHIVEEIKNADLDKLFQLADWLPAWQQMNKRVANWGDSVSTFCIRENDDIIAFAHLNNNTKRILQFAVNKDHRRKGIGTALFQHMSKGTELTIVNVDDNCEKSNAFLNAIGMQPFISQYEMEMTL